MTPDEIADLRHQAMQELIRWETPGSDGERAHFWLRAFLRATESQVLPKLAIDQGANPWDTGDFARPRYGGRGKVHIVAMPWLSGIQMACGKEWEATALVPDDDSDPRRCCPTCWEAM